MNGGDDDGDGGDDDSGDDNGGHQVVMMIMAGPRLVRPSCCWMDKNLPQLPLNI